MSSKKKKRSIGAAIALALIVPVMVVLTPALLGATTIPVLEQSETFTFSPYGATLNIQVTDLGDKYEYAFTLSSNPNQPGFYIFGMSIGWGVSTELVPIVQASDVVLGSGVDLKTPPVDDPTTTSTRIYAGSLPLMTNQSFDTVLMYFAREALTQHYISISSNKGSAMKLVEYSYPESSIPEPATILLLSGAVIALGVLSRRKKMVI